MIRLGSVPYSSSMSAVLFSGIRPSD